MSVSISHTTKSLPRGRFSKIAENILGVKFDVSIVFIGERRALLLNQETRNKNYVPNVLSFPLSKSAGEIFICPTAARKECKDFGLSFTHYLEYLCIHGCVHVLGYDHGSKMDALEKKYTAKYGIKISE